MVPAKQASYCDTINLGTGATTTMYWEGAVPTAGTNPGSGKEGVDVYTFHIQHTGADLNTKTFNCFANVTYFVKK